jgi:hypothetical protein
MLDYALVGQRLMSGTEAYNIRYIGFESLADARRRMEYAITAKGMPARRATVEIPASAFSGLNRVSFQESASIGYEKVRREISLGIPADSPLTFVLTPADIEAYRPRRRTATSTKKA